MFIGYILPKLFPQLVAFPSLSCDIPLIYSSQLPQCPLPPLIFAFYRVGNVSVLGFLSFVFYLLRYLGSNFFVILCKRLTFLNDVLELYSNRSLKNDVKSFRVIFLVSGQWHP